MSDLTTVTSAPSHELPLMGQNPWGRARVRETLERLLALYKIEENSHRLRIDQAIRMGAGVVSFRLFLSFPEGISGDYISRHEQEFRRDASRFSIESAKIECVNKLNTQAIIDQTVRFARDFVYRLEELIFQKLKHLLNTQGDDYNQDLSTCFFVEYEIRMRSTDMTRYLSAREDCPGFPAVFRSQELDMVLYSGRHGKPLLK